MKEYYVERPTYIQDENENEFIVVDMQFVSEKVVEKNVIKFKVSDKVFAINSDRFSEDLISYLSNVEKIELQMYKGDTEKKLTLRKI